MTLIEVAKLRNSILSTNEIILKKRILAQTNTFGFYL
jgi:hypothetical protein